MKHVMVVTGGEDDRRLVELLAERLSLSPDELEGWIRAGSVYLDGRRETRPGWRVRAGQQVIARPPAGSVAPLAEVVYRDEDLAVVEKPAGLHSMTPRQGGESLQSQLVELLGTRARLLHRLDQETSGLLLCAVSLRARRHLAEAVAAHQLHRRYLALVAGAPREPALTLSSRLGQRGGAHPSQDPRARLAVTRVVLLRRFAAGSLLQAELQTGRTHQIRAQLASVGLPLLGDQRYGGLPAPRLALHAHLLGVRGPDGAWIEVHSPLPAELRTLLGE